MVSIGYIFSFQSQPTTTLGKNTAYWSLISFIKSLFCYYANYFSFFITSTAELYAKLLRER